MHGRVKDRPTAKQEALKKQERAEKLKKYRAGINIVLQKRKDKIYDDELMTVTERMLLQNPYIYTLWNIRREAFLNNDWEGDRLEEFHKKELKLTENCLRENPKSYCVWHQRVWVMNRMAEPDWKRELSLCATCLGVDERNLHCWDYREFVVQKAGISPSEEFDFATSEILNNFSNYSSWHYRSRLLSKMFCDLDDRKISEIKKDELDLVMNATFTDPSDSSAWFYQRWLLDTNKSSASLWRAVIREHSAVLYFDHEVSVESISLDFDDEKAKAKWNSPGDSKLSRLWFGELLEPMRNREEASVKLEENVYRLKRSGETWVFKRSKAEPTCNEQLLEQLSSYKQLAEMEPNNKWALLTGVLLMRKIDPIKHHAEILTSLGALVSVDSLRCNYYKDLRSKYVVEHRLDQLWKSEGDFEVKSQVDLSGLDLTTLHNDECLGFFEEVNLGANSLSRSLHRLVSLQACKKLSLSSNQLENLKTFPSLPNLRVLSLRNNKLCDAEDILGLVGRHQLTRLDIRENPVDEIERLRAHLAQTNPNLELCV